MLVHSGEIRIPVNRLNRREIAYLYSVIRNAKCDQIDIYYTNGAIYIGADSLDTHLIALYKIQLEEIAQNKVQVATTTTESLDDIFGDDLSDLMQSDEVMIDNSQGEVQGFNTPVTPPAPTPVVAPPPVIVPPPPMPTIVPPPAPQEQEPTKASSSVDGTGDVLYFCTLTEFLQSLLIEDKVTKEVIISVEGRKVNVVGGDYSFTYPAVKGYISMDYYLDAMRDKTWERVNVEAVQKVAKAISSTNTNIAADMFVTLERDRVFSDNSFLLVSASSWKLQDRYHFTYQTVPALVKLPVGAEGEAYVSKSQGMIYLRFNEMYLAWTNEDNGQSENILELVNISAMAPVLTLKADDVKRLRLFSKMIAGMQVEVDRVVKFEMIDNGLSKVTQDENTLLCRVNCLKGIEIEVDLESLLTATGLCNTKDPVIMADVSNKESDFLLVRGGLDVLINAEKVRKV